MLRKHVIKHKDKRLLKETARRAMVGAISIHDGITTLDPTGHMMNKSHSRIFNLNRTEFDTMLDVHGMTQEEGIAHVELISSLPVLTKYEGSFIIENEPAIPTTRLTVLSKYFADASYNVSGGDQAENTIDAIVLPAGTGKTTYSSMYDELIDIDDIIGTPEAMKTNRPLIENEKWNELSENQTTQLLEYLLTLDHEPIFLIHHKNQFDERLDVRTLYSARLPKTAMLAIAKEREASDPLHAEATITNWKSSVDVPIRSRSEIDKKIKQIAIDRKSSDVLSFSEVELPEIIRYENSWPSSWENVVESNGTHPPVFWTKNEREYSSPRAASFLAASQLDTKKYKMIPYSEFNTYKKVLSAFKQFLIDNKDEDEVHLWIQGVLPTQAGSIVISTMMDNLTGDVLQDARMPGGPALGAVTTYWKSSVLHSKDLYAHYANRRPPSRIPVIGCRVSNWGMRIYGDSTLYPQMSPPTTLHKDLGIPRSMLIEPLAKYLNYSKHIKLRTITEDEIETLDFAYRRDPRGHYTMSMPAPGTYTISNPEFMNGFSSVCTSAHSTYGYGRDPSELVFQMSREIDSGHGTSGHMIASCLMFRAHVLLYLNDVHYNNTTNKSIYNLEMKEPTSGRYHTNQEYKHAIEDINNLMEGTDFGTKHARSNFELIKAFVNLMK
jgi:hypothetical protein